MKKIEFAEIEIPGTDENETNKSARADLRVCPFDKAKQKPDAGANADAPLASSNSIDAAIKHAANIIPPRTCDPIREKFTEMRRLSSERPFARNESELFYKQAKFMQGFSDDWEMEIPLKMYYPSYQRMGYENLRTYFTWRTKIRNNIYEPTSTSYIFLYIYELLSGVGIKNPSDGLSKLIEIWKAYADEHEALKRYIPLWLKDYFIFYGTGNNFKEFVTENELSKYYSLSLLLSLNKKDDKTSLVSSLNKISAYNMETSKFYKDGNAELYARYLHHVVDEINELCKAKGLKFEDLIVYKISQKAAWRPFENALFCCDIDLPDRETQISEYEIYYCKNNKWTAALPIYYSSQRDFIGYIIKKTESVLRNVTQYKYKLAAEMKSGKTSFMELAKIGIRKRTLDKLIEQTIENEHIKSKQVIVEVNEGNLAKIREEALENQEKLKIEEEQAIGANTSSLNAQPPPVQAQIIEDKTKPTTDPWSEFKNTLTHAELETLQILATSSAVDLKTVRNHANKNDIMLEVLIDNINEKSADTIGDAIIEMTDQITIYEDYIDDVRMIV